MFCTLLLDSITSYAVSAVFLGIFRCFLFSTFFGYVAKTFGFEHYGAVVGVAAIIAGVLSQLVLVLNWVAYTYGFIYVNIGVAVIIGLIFPLALTLGVWETDVESDDLKHGDPSLNLSLKSQDSFGSRISYKWSRFANITPRRLRQRNKNLFTEGNK